MTSTRAPVITALLLLPAFAFAQDGVGQPGEAARKRAAETDTAEPMPADDDRYYNAFDAPAVDRIVVVGKPGLHEEELFGAYKQPRWTARRRFPTSRVYVRPEGQFAVEYWLRATTDLSNFDRADSRKYRSIYEAEFGLGHRLQLDLYLVLEQKGHDEIEIHKESIELRYALADWGEIWGNPTLYFEYGRHGSEDQFVEGKLLFGGELATGLHGGLNLVFERLMSGAEVHEYKITAGISKTIVDTVFSVGAEAAVEFVDEMGSRFDFLEKKYLLGPSVSWQPQKSMHLLLTPLFGLGQEKADDGEYENVPLWENWLVVGWDY